MASIIISIFLIFLSQSFAYKGGRTPPPTCKNNTVATYSYESEVSCQTMPKATCTYGECAPAKCATAKGWCKDKYLPMPASAGFKTRPGFSSPVKVVTRFGLVGNKAHPIAKFTDPGQQMILPTGSVFEISGGQTVCDIGIMTGVHHSKLTDDVLTMITSFSRPIVASCSYFAPEGGACCTSWTPPECCPP